MIQSFKCKETEKLFHRLSVKRFSQIEKIARRKLAILNAAVALNDLKIPPGNRLEPLKGNRKEQYSIRINDQWRICFKWGIDHHPKDVEIIDYH